MTTSHWLKQHSVSTPDAVTDILIIGGGYIGLSTAYWLSEMKPGLKITVLEGKFCGAGASGRNAGFLTKGSVSFYKSLTKTWGRERAEKLYRFAEESLELAYQHILKSSDVTFDSSSSMTLFQTADQLAEWSTAGFAPENFNFSWKNQSQLPKALQSRFHGAFENSPEYKINPVQLLARIRQLIESRGVRIIESSMAFEITSSGVSTESQTIKARQVILALNGYLPQFHSLFKNVIVPRRAQMLAAQIEEGFDCPSLYYDPPERVYWRKADEKTLLIGGKRLLDEEGEVGDFEKISPVIQKGLEQYLKDQLGLKYKVIKRWSGTMGFTEHELPLVGKVNAPLETYMIGGFSGHGMGLGFHSAKDLAQLVTGNSKESFFNQFKKVDFTL